MNVVVLFPTFVAVRRRRGIAGIDDGLTSILGGKEGEGEAKGVHESLISNVHLFVWFFLFFFDKLFTE